MKFGFYLLLSCLLVFNSCKDKDELSYPNTPDLVFLKQNQDVITYGEEDSYLLIQFNFSDGDGDLGRRVPEEDSSFIVEVVRVNDTTNTRYSFPFPQIGSNSYQKNGALAGSVELYFENAFFMPRMDSVHMTGYDTLSYKIYLQDEAGNRSQTVEVGPIYIEP